MRIVSLFVLFISIIIGVYFSPIPERIGLYRLCARMFPASIGMTPLRMHSPMLTPWGYTFEEYYGRDCKSIQGQNALVTGANSGIGYQIATALAKCGVSLTLACMNPELCERAANEMKMSTKMIESEARSRYSNGNDRNESGSSGTVIGDTVGTITINTMTVDLSSLTSVQEFSEAYLVKNGGIPLDMLFLNAGRAAIYGEQIPVGQKPNLALSEDGIEIIFATNYVGHHLIWKYLEPLVKKSEMGRVILTASASSFITFPHKVATSLEELHSTADAIPQSDFKYYGQSKLAQILWAKKVTRLLESDVEGHSDGGGDSTSTVLTASNSVYVNAAINPGVVNSAIWDVANFPSFVYLLLNPIRKRIMWTSKEGALTLLYLGAATEQLREMEVKGKYFHAQTQEVVNPFALDEKLQDDLW
eukprot:CAMPEP_0194094878 /NCGR_PEP_ID=MMETSP0149-20130528/55856_1 /TAXON_ID=122233 /ORGANISM="Chaetoceros debilis, Strain MM31A-1" /LENGTH=417 /DNA_ID=CAMNT_0038780739 /DNA_START=234 /DNA_END=1485 /DNA_ORIENTATION=+